jgi:2-polyprenyl-3-methyl-5-hydroxy-6-metoxy-1,4-benzoquinol methylase
MSRISVYPLPGDDSRVIALSEASERLRKKLLGLDTPSVGLSDYSRRYLEGTLVNDVSKPNLYAYLLFLGFRNAEEVVPSARAVMDYRGGNGLLSLLAREAGVGTVVYTDLEAASTSDARRLASALELEADHYVAGDLDDVLRFVRSANIDVKVMCSYDVIEHVHDIDAFLRSVPEISDGRLQIVFRSGANGANPRIRRNLLTLQRQQMKPRIRCLNGATSRLTLPRHTHGYERRLSAAGRLNCHRRTSRRS